MAFVAGKDSALYVSGWDVGQFFNSVSLPASQDVEETSGFGDSSKEYTPTMHDGELSASGFFDGAASAIHPIMDGFGRGGIVLWELLPEGDVEGNVACLVRGLDNAYEVNSPVEGVVAVEVSAQASPGGIEYGKIHYAKATVSAGTVSPGTINEDNGGGSSGGAWGVLQVFGVPSGTITAASIQHSTDGSTGWSDLITFGATSSNGAERATASGTVRQYRRARIVANGDVTAHVASGLLRG